jgi:hypothetical protein
VALVLSWRIPGGTGRLGADVRISSGPTGELDVSPSGPFLSVTNLEPGSADVAEGTFVVRNQTGSGLAVRLRAVPSAPDLDELLVMEVRTSDGRLLQGTLGGLREWSDRSFLLASGESQALRVRTWLRPVRNEGYQGRAEDVDLQLRAEPKGA